MPDVKGRDVTIHIGDGSGPPENFAAIARAQVHTLTINNSEVDVTAKDDGGWRRLSPDAGLKSVVMSLNGVFDSSTDQERLKDLAFSASAQATFRFIDGSGEVLEGEFQVTSFEITGETEGVAQFSCTLSSSGTITST